MDVESKRTDELVSFHLKITHFWYKYSHLKPYKLVKVSFCSLIGVGIQDILVFIDITIFIDIGYWFIDIGIYKKIYVFRESENIKYLIK